MDSVPIVFSERVLATRKCCRIQFGCSCPKPLFAAPKWNQPADTRQPQFDFFIGPVAYSGQWGYGFFNRANNRFLSMDEVMKLPNFKKVRFPLIEFIEPNEATYDHRLRYDIGNLQKLLNFVSFLSNDPRLNINSQPALNHVSLFLDFLDDGVDPIPFQFFRSPQGRAMLHWLEEESFSEIHVQTLTPVYQRILENQRYSTDITIKTLRESAPFLARRLMSGALRRVIINDCYVFSSTVLNQVIRNVMERPADYSKHRLEIQAYFDDAATKKYKNKRIRRFRDQKPYGVKIVGIGSAMKVSSL